MFVDQIQDPTIIDGPWESADNYTEHSNGIDQLAVTLEYSPKPTPSRATK